MAEDDPSQAALAMMRRFWDALGASASASSPATPDLGEVDKRIVELRALETWLTANLNMTRVALQGLELQKSAIEALRAGMEPAGAPGMHPGGGAPATGGTAMPPLWPWAGFPAGGPNRSGEPGSKK